MPSPALLLHLEWLHAISPLAAGVLLRSIWQGSVLVGGVALALRVARGVSPAVRSRIWTSVLLLLLLLPLVGLLLPQAQVTGQARVHVAEQWSLALLALWVCGSAVRAAQLAGHAVGLWRLSARAVPVATEARLQVLLGGPRRAKLCVSSEINRPSVVGFLWPRVLLPTDLMETLAPAELEHVVLHEMEHLRRYDDWINLLQQVSLVLLPLHPALVWLDRRLCRERELACDDGVLRATRAHKAYAACLVKLAEESLARKGMLLALGALGTRARESELVTRVRRILARPELVNGRGTLRSRTSVGLVTAGMVAGVFGLVHSPQWVSFEDGAAPQVAAVAEMPGVAAAAARMTPVMVMSSAVPARTVAAIAVVNRAGEARPVEAVAVVKPRTRARVLPLRTGWTARRAAPMVTQRPVARMVRAGVQPGFTGAPRLQQTRAVMDGSAAGRMPSARLVSSEFEVSQPLYAAVPWRGGWLIFQL